MGKLTIIEHNGKLALDLGSTYLPDRPVMMRYLRLSNINAADYDGIVGQRAEFFDSTWQANVYPKSGRCLRLDATDWTNTELEVAQAKPRDGKDYSWGWNIFGSTYTSGQPMWMRVDFPRCDTCGKYHNPAFTYDESADRCVKPAARKHVA